MKVRAIAAGLLLFAGTAAAGTLEVKVNLRMLLTGRLPVGGIRDIHAERDRLRGHHVQARLLHRGNQCVPHDATNFG